MRWEIKKTKQTKKPLWLEDSEDKKELTLEDYLTMEELWQKEKNLHEKKREEMKIFKHRYEY